eukprot:Skav236760  [mRNA]  locus=scaffold3662:70570:73518:+ [translate_table: standard]
MWLASETHLTPAALTQFRSGLKQQRSKFQYTIGGHPVPSRSVRTATGVWRGVACISSKPTRALPHLWSEAVHASSRLGVFSTLINDMWITAGIMYGECESSQHPHYCEHNDQMLRELVIQVCCYSAGPRVVGGDFNVTEDQITSFSLLHEYGFRDIQSLAAERWGTPIVPTCKRTTRKDWMFISPELQSMLVATRVQDDLWSDHATLEAWFQGGVRDIPRYAWFVPQPMQWPQPFECAVSWPATGTPTQDYLTVWQTLEQAALEQNQVNTRRSVGRAKQLKPQRCVGSVHAPLKASRHGEVTPGFHGCSLQHSRWFKQLRRIQSYVHHIKSRNADVHAVELWSAVTHAKGFHPTFAAWWAQSEHKVHGAPLALPPGPPDYPLAQAIFDSVHLAVKNLEKQLRKHNVHYARVRRVEDPNLIFRDVRPATPGNLDLLLRPLAGRVTLVDAASLQVVLDQELPFDADHHVFCEGKSYDVIHAERDSVWLSTVEGIEVGSCLRQIRSTGRIEDLFAVFRKEWVQRWQRHHDVPHSQWQNILQFARSTIVRTEVGYPPLSAPSLHHMASCKKKRSAKGLDGVSVPDQQLGPTHLQPFCDMFREAETTGCWPDQLLQGKVSSLAKCAAPCSAGDFRPITILSVLYRMWGSHHARLLLRSLDAVLPEDLHGSRPARHATQVWYDLLWLLEFSEVHAAPVAGLIADLQKAFNYLPRLVILEVGALFGLPVQILTGWAGALSSLQRFFVVRDNVGPGIYSSTGMAEGDALSCVGMVLCDALLHHWVTATCQMVRPVTYVDDWQFLCRQVADIQRTWDQVTAFAALMDLRLDTSKTFTWSTATEDRRILRTQGFQTRTNARVLGAHVQLCRKHTNSHLVSRVESLQELWPKLRVSLSPYRFKVRALRAAAWPKGLHGVESTKLAPHHFTNLRTGAMRGLKADGPACNPQVHLGMVEQTATDPEYWALERTLRTLRMCGQDDEVRTALVHAAQ